MPKQDDDEVARLTKNLSEARSHYLSQNGRPENSMDAEDADRGDAMENADIAKKVVTNRKAKLERTRRAIDVGIKNAYRE